MSTIRILKNLYTLWPKHLLWLLDIQFAVTVLQSCAELCAITHLSVSIATFPSISFCSKDCDAELIIISWLCGVSGKCLVTRKVLRCSNLFKEVILADIFLKSKTSSAKNCFNVLSKDGNSCYSALFNRSTCSIWKTKCSYYCSWSLKFIMNMSFTVHNSKTL